MSNQARVADLQQVERTLLTSFTSPAAAECLAAVGVAAQRALSASAGQPVPTPAATASAVRVWTGLAEEWRRAGEQVRSAAAEIPGYWVGQDADAAVGVLDRHRSQSGVVASRCEDVATLLARATATAEVHHGDWIRARSRLVDTGPAGGVSVHPTFDAADAARAAGELLSSVRTLIGVYTKADETALATARAIRSATEMMSFNPVPLTPFSVSPTRVRRSIEAADPAAPGTQAGAAPAAGSAVPRIAGTAARRPSPLPVSPASLRKAAAATRSAKPAVGGTARPGATGPSAPVRPPAGWKPPVGPTPAAAGATAARTKLLSVARELIGVPYVWGGTTRRGFDCSGFTRYVYARIGVSLPRTSSQQRRAGSVIPKSQARPGDLVSMPGHVGIYVGDGRMIDAPRPGGRVSERRIWTDDYVVVRVLPS